jgi:aconitase A
VEPTINGPFTPDLATPLSKFASFVKENGWSDELSVGLIGSCTNSSYEDMVIWTFPTHRSAINLLTDTRCKLSPTSQGSWAEDAGLEIDNLATVERS